MSTLTIVILSVVYLFINFFIDKHLFESNTIVGKLLAYIFGLPIAIVLLIVQSLSVEHNDLLK